jgi:phosphonate transport system substrate-binding protein
MKITRLLQTLFASLMVAALLLSACAPAPAAQPTAVQQQPTNPPAATTAPTVAPTVAPTTAPTMAPTVAPTAEPTAVPARTLGTPADPIIMAIAPSATTDVLISSGDTLAQLLEAETGLTIRAVVPTNYKAMIEAMCSGNAQVGWLPPFAYLVAHQTTVADGAGTQVTCADVAFVTLRNQLDHYATQFIGRADQFTAGTDLASLQQLAGKKPCWTDQFSASGYVIPASLLAAEGVKTRAAAFVQGHPTVVRAVYAGGICDFGATYVDARSDSGIQADLPDVREKVVVVYQTENIIPNDTVGYAWDLPAEQREILTAALAKIATTEEGAAALRTLYSIDGMREADDEFFDEFRVLLAASGIDIAALVR